MKKLVIWGFWVFAKFFRGWRALCGQLVGVSDFGVKHASRFSEILSGPTRNYISFFITRNEKTYVILAMADLFFQNAERRAKLLRGCLYGFG